MIQYILISLLILQQINPSFQEQYTKSYTLQENKILNVQFSNKIKVTVDNLKQDHDLFFNFLSGPDDNLDQVSIYTQNVKDNECTVDKQQKNCKFTSSQIQVAKGEQAHKNSVDFILKCKEDNNLCNTYILQSYKISNKADTSLQYQQEGQLQINDTISADQPVYYVFDANIQSGDEQDYNQLSQDFIINLQAPTNKAIIVVDTDLKIPSLNQYQWNSKTNYLRIRTDQDNFVQSGKFVIGIIMNQEKNNNSVKNQKIPIKLSVSRIDYIRPLNIGETVFEVSEPNIQNQEFVISLNQTYIQKYIFLTRNVMSDENHSNKLKFQIGAQKEEEFIGEDGPSYNIPTVELCGNEWMQQKDQNCSIYVRVTNLGQNNSLSYSLTLWETETPIELTDGMPYQFGLYQIDDYTKFYYKPLLNNQSINFDLYSHFGFTNYSIKIYNNRDNSPSYDWPYPSNDVLDSNFVPRESNFIASNEYGSEVQTSHSFTLSQEMVSRFTENIVILISVSFMELDYDVQLQSDQYKLQIWSGEANIYPGDRREFSLENQTDIQTFYLQVKDIPRFKPVDLQLTSIQGYSNMTAYMRDDSGNQITQILLEQNQISSSQYNQIPLEQNPTIVIQVQGKGTHTLQINTNQNYNTEFDLLQMQPQEFELSGYKSIQFRYYHYMNSNLIIKIVRDYGIGILKVTSCKHWIKCDENEDNYDYILSKQKFISGQTNSEFEIKKKDDLWCTNCYYKITYKSMDYGKTRGFISIQNKQDPQGFRLPADRTLIDSAGRQENRKIYKITVPSNEEFTLSMIVYWGNPRVYISYHPSSDFKDYDLGPYRKNTTKGQDLIEVKIPSRLNSTESKKENSYYSLYSNMIQKDIYIMVINHKKAKLQSRYSISYSTGSQKQRYLSDGHIIPTFIGPKQSISFRHEHYDKEENPIFSYILKNSTFYKKNNIKAHINFYPQNYMSGYNENNSLYIETPPYLESDSLSSYALPNRTGIYNITLQNTGTEELELDASVNTRDITLLPLNHTFTHYLEEEAVNYFEMFIPNSGYIALELSQLTGRLYLGISQEYEQFVNHAFEKQIYYTSSGQNSSEFIQVNKGILYIAVVSQDKEYSLYSLRANFYKNQDKIPQNRLQNAYSQYFSLSQISKNEIFIEFKTFKCFECNSMEIQEAKVRYTAIISTNQEILQAMGVFNMTRYFKHEIDYILNEQIMMVHVFQENYDLSQYIKLNHTFPIKDENKDKIYYATVKAEITNFPGLEGQTAKKIFNTQQIDLKNFQNPGNDSQQQENNQKSQENNDEKENVQTTGQIPQNRNQEENTLKEEFEIYKNNLEKQLQAKMEELQKEKSEYQLELEKQLQQQREELEKQKLLEKEQQKKLDEEIEELDSQKKQLKQITKDLEKEKEELQKIIQEQKDLQEILKNRDQREVREEKRDSIYKVIVKEQRDKKLNNIDDDNEENNNRGN